MFGIGRMGFRGGLDAAASAEQAETTAFFLATVAAGAADPSTAQRQRVDTLIADLKTAGVWTKLDVVRLYVAHDEITARHNLRDPAKHLAVPTASPSWSTSGYATVAASSQYVDEAFNPTAASQQFARDSATLATWQTVAGSATNAAVGWNATGGSTINPRNGASALLARINQTTESTYGTVASRAGFSLITRRGAAETEAYKDGVSVGTGTVASVAPVNATFSTGRVTAASFAGGTYGATIIGAGLTTEEQLALYNALRAYMTAWGIP